jgi:hypothetical protein
MALFLSGDIHEGNRSAVLVFDIELGIETISWYYKNITNNVLFINLHLLCKKQNRNDIVNILNQAY